MSTAARSRTLTQLYALVLGAVLLVIGILGFIADASFGPGNDVEGSDFISSRSTAGTTSCTSCRACSGWR